jgi:phosphoribosyl-ATP pyrophosphohydrolase/phosphoribosyl-AMP cyclohydrolase
VTAHPPSPARLDVRFGADGLAPAIVQDAADGTVLMLGWMDAEALEATTSTGEVHFHSRSRDRLWRKGETSGHVLRLASIAVDCDGDALLVKATPAGPTCHRGTRTCFDDTTGTETSEPAGFGWLDTLWSTIAERAAMMPEGSYTATLLQSGVDGVARKVAEEATEVVIAAKNDAAAGSSETRTALAGEVADLLYHTLVVLADRNVPPSKVIDVLRQRRRG